VILFALWEVQKWTFYDKVDVNFNWNLPFFVDQIKVKSSYRLRNSIRCYVIAGGNVTCGLEGNPFEKTCNTVTSEGLQHEHGEDGNWCCGQQCKGTVRANAPITDSKIQRAFQQAVTCAEKSRKFELQHIYNSKI